VSAEYYFDEQEANRAITFFEKFLRHSKGEFAGKPFILEPWQKKIVSDVWGWRRTADKLRKYRILFLEVPRKNGKSTLAAGLALLLTFADKEPGAEVYGAAADTGQARIVFDEAKKMMFQSPSLMKRGKPYLKSLVHMKGALPVGKFEVISADAHTKHGFNSSGIIFDELHAQPNRELWDVLTTSTGSRRQPLTVGITTAGWDRKSICWEVHEYAERVISGVFEDPTFYGVIYGADVNEDWTDPGVWARANPNLGISLRMDYMERECQHALQSPAYENTFRRLHLNQWTEQETRFIPMERWRAGGPLEHSVEWRAETMERMKGRMCYAGLDLSTRYDLTALVLVFPPHGDENGYTVLPWFWIPEENMHERIKRDRVPYDVWVREGFVQATPGNIIDHAFVRSQLKDLNERFKIREIAFDRWGAGEISVALQGDGFTLVEFGQGFASMSAPMKEMLSLILAGRLSHGGNPVMTWNAASVTALQDAAGNVKPVKPDRQKSANRIDGIVALIMGLARAIANGANQESVYQKRGVRVLEW